MRSSGHPRPQVRARRHPGGGRGPARPAGPPLIRAAALAGTLSGLPSTIYNLLRRRPALETARAAGNVILPAEAGTKPLLAAGAAAHAALSLGWAAVITAVARRSARPVLAGAASGLIVAAIDLGAVAHGVARRRMALIRALPVLPQVADHVAFGLVVGAVCARGKGRADE